MAGLGCRRITCSRLWALFLALCALAEAQIYTFDKQDVPGNRSLHTLYAFYVYSHQDSPEKLWQPFVQFASLSMDVAFQGPNSTIQRLMDYKGIQVSIFPYSKFWDLINATKFCAGEEDVQFGFQKDQLLVNTSQLNFDIRKYIYTVRADADGTSSVKRPVRTTGVYILVHSNCGNETAFKVKGSVIVKNSYGFLPGNEYHKMPFYKWLFVAYLIAAFAWMARSLYHWRELFSIHYCICAVVLLGLVEAFIWMIFFTEWNESGQRPSFLFILAILSSVVKSVFSYMLVLVASLGWGVTRPFLDQKTVMQVQAVSVLYIALDFFREWVLSFRHSHSLSIAFVLLCLLPVSLLNGAIFYWIFTALSSLMETLKERRQLEKFVLFQRLWKILVLALSVATCSLLFQIFDLSRGVSMRWHYQWFFAEGVSHLLFMFVLASMMYLWAPHANSQRYVYSMQVEDKEVSDDKAIWGDEDVLDDDGEDDSFWASTRKSQEEREAKSSSLGATKIGAASEENVSVLGA